MNTNIKSRLLVSASLFVGGFVSAVALVIFTAGSLSPSAAEGNLFLYNPQTGEMGPLPFSRFHEREEKEQENEYEHEEEFESESEDEDNEYEEKSKRQEDGSSEKEVLRAEIKEIEEHEAALLQELQEELPGSPEYEELRNELRELKMQKMNLNEQKRALESGLGVSNQKTSKLQLIRERARERQAIIEACRQAEPTNPGRCVAQKLGKQKNRAAYHDTEKFEALPQTMEKPRDSEFNRPNNWQAPTGIKAIMAECAELPAIERQTCIKTRLVNEKNRILEEAQRRVRALEESLGEAGSTYSQPIYSPAPEMEKMPRTKEEWREYNEKYNSEPTI